MAKTWFDPKETDYHIHLRCKKCSKDWAFAKHEIKDVPGAINRFKAYGFVCPACVKKAKFDQEREDDLA